MASTAGDGGYGNMHDLAAIVHIKLETVGMILSGILRCCERGEHQHNEESHYLLHMCSFSPFDHGCSSRARLVDLIQTNEGPLRADTCQRILQTWNQNGCLCLNILF